ncbi:hypothetical protein ABBQ32_006367 [Trebouxia sp. C0010 RCD-2024]
MTRCMLYNKGRDHEPLSAEAHQLQNAEVRVRTKRTVQSPCSLLLSCMELKCSLSPSQAATDSCNLQQLNRGQLRNKLQTMTELHHGLGQTALSPITHNQGSFLSACRKPVCFPTT